MFALVDGADSGGRALPKEIGQRKWASRFIAKPCFRGMRVLAFTCVHTHIHIAYRHIHTIQPEISAAGNVHGHISCVFTWAMFWVPSCGKPQSFVLWPSPSRLPWSLFLCCSYWSKTLDMNDWSYQESEWSKQRFPVTLRRMTEWIPLPPPPPPGSDYYGYFILLQKIGKPWHCLEQLGWLTRPS